jgi:hypothetical protein
MVAEAAAAALLGGGAPSAAVVLLAVLALFSVLLITRALSNAFPGSKPPIVEGVPYVGGLLKFAKVRVLDCFNWAGAKEERGGGHRCSSLSNARVPAPSAQASNRAPPLSSL